MYVYSPENPLSLCQVYDNICALDKMEHPDPNEGEKTIHLACYNTPEVCIGGGGGGNIQQSP